MPLMRSQARPRTAAALLLLIAAVTLAPCGQALAFVAADRWAATASGSTAFRGKPATITWSLVPDSTVIADRQPSRLVAMLDGALGLGSGGNDLRQRPWFSLIELSFARWSALGGATFAFEPHDDGAPLSVSPGALDFRGDVRLAATPGDGLGGLLASSQFPDAGDIVFDADDAARLGNPNHNFRWLRNALMHEIGHTLGLEHVASSYADALMEPVLSLDFDGPQLDDIRGLHQLYGDRFERLHDGRGNDEPAFAVPLGIIQPGDELALGIDASRNTPIGFDDTDFLSLSGLGDADFFAFDLAAPARLDLTLDPQGGRYRQGLPGKPEVLVDASASSDLSLGVLAPDGTELTAVDAQPRGLGERVDALLLPAAGRYVLRVAGSRDVVQLYALQLRLQGVATPEPSALAMATLWLAVAARLRRVPCR